MGSASTKAYANRMRKECGELYSEHCNDCCNCQRQTRGKDAKACIAYGIEYIWDPSERACGLFNVPFRGIRPRRRPIGESYIKKDPQSKNQNMIENQESLF